MDAADIIRTLISLGGTVKDLVIKHTRNGAVDWVAVISAATTDPSIAGDVKRMLGELRASDMKSAIDEIQRKQTSLLRGRSLPQLSNAEMLQFDDLADAKLVLATHQLKAALDQNVGEWLVQNALPVLKAAAPIVLPLLL